MSLRAPPPQGPAPVGSAEPKLRESCWPCQIPAHPLLVVAGRMRSSSTAPLAEKMACPAPDATVAADPGGAGPFRSSEEPEGREPDGVRFDRERARLLWEAVSGAQPAGREEGESGAPGFAAGPRRGGLPPVTPLAPANLCTTIRSSELARSLSLWRRVQDLVTRYPAEFFRPPFGGVHLRTVSPKF